MTTIREFVCKYCGHTLVVNPNFPKDELPTTCTPCYDKIVKPKSEHLMREFTLWVKRLAEP